VPPAKVLVVDDDETIRELVAALLRRAGHQVLGAPEGRAALRVLFRERVELVLLDLDMPGLDGWQTLERVRELSDVPVIMLTGQERELDKVRALRAGADDYVVKPFGHQELVARADALLRRSAGGRAAAPPDVYSDAALTVDHEQRTVRVDDIELALTPLEFRLLAAFVRHPGQVLSADRLLDLVWGDRLGGRDQVKLAVGRLRAKLAPHLDETPITTVRGFGYRYAPPTTD
jgi:DNA-binding response OmpR family regulator